MIRKAVQTLAKMTGYRIIRFRNNYDADGLYTSHSDAFRSRADFRAAYNRGLQTVTTDPRHEWRVHIALWCASTATKLPGDFVECGVFVGFMSSAIMKFLDWDEQGKMFYLIDTFEGPQPEQLNEEEIGQGRIEEIRRLREIGGYDYNFQTVKENFKEWRNVNLIKGVVPEILPECPSEAIAYLHVDMNCAYPETSALRYFWKKIVPGGIVLLDDYAYSGYEGQRVAMEEVARELGIEIASLPTGQGLIVKPGSPSSSSKAGSSAGVG